MDDRIDRERGAPRDVRDPAMRARAATEEEGVLTLVCFKCGTEYYFQEGGPPEEMSCEKCGNTVFRSFYTAQGSEAADDFDDTTRRDMNPDDAEGETMPGDVLDLNRD